MLKARFFPLLTAVGLTVAFASGCGDPGDEPPNDAPSDRVLDAASDTTAADRVQADATPDAAADGASDAMVDTPVEVTDAAPDVATEAADGTAEASTEIGATDGSAEGGASEAVSDVGKAELEPYVGPLFVDVTKAAGITHVQSTEDACTEVGACGTAANISGGVAVGDLDGDNWPDLVVSRLQEPLIYYRSNGDGTFTDTTLGSGLEVADRLTNGIGLCDVDNDGDLDVYVSFVYAMRYAFFVNLGGGKFAEEGAARGLAIENPSWHMGTSVACGDYDRDGYLDLYVGEWRKKMFALGQPTASRLFRNRGAEKPGFFEDATTPAGVALTTSPTADVYSFAPTFIDLDDDGWPDLPVISDFGTTKMFWNRGDGTFEEETKSAGLAKRSSEMGSSYADFDGDGLIDLFVTAIWPSAMGSAHNGNALYRNLGGRLFEEIVDSHPPLRFAEWAWGTALFDYDNDADLDVAVANGYRQMDFDSDPFHLWRREKSGDYAERAADAGLSDDNQGRGLVVFDYDKDGDLDLLVVNQRHPARLWRNDGGNTGDWLRVEPRLPTHNQFGWGARVTVRLEKDGPFQIQVIGATTNYLGQSEAVAHFGLGSGTKPVAEVRVRWPRSGKERVYTDVPRRTTLVAEPESDSD